MMDCHFVNYVNIEKKKTIKGKNNNGLMDFTFWSKRETMSEILSA